MRRKIMGTLEQQVAPTHTAILVVDMQNAFFSEESTLGDKEAKRALVPRLQRFIDGARASHVPLVFIRMVQTADDDSPRAGRRRNRRAGRNSLRPGSWGSDFIPEIQPGAGDALIEKTRFNAFLNTPLDSRLQAKGIKTIVVTGVYTNVCVGMTACDGSMRNYYVVVPEDLVVGTEQSLHESMLANIGRYFGTVSTSNKLLQTWKTQNTGKRASQRATPVA